MPDRPTPTRHRAQILAVLKEWFLSHDEGPTFEELAVLLGLAPSQRGTVLKWLRTLPDDVEWDSRRPRSLRLKPLHRPESGLRLAPEETLRFLATGLVEHGVRPAEERAIASDALRVGASRLWLHGLMSHAPAPADLPALLDTLHRPIVDMLPAGNLDWLSPEAVLLEDGVVTDLALSWAVEGEDVVSQVQEAAMEEIVILCRTQRLDEAYRYLRAVLIRTPVLTAMDYRQLLVRRELLPLRQLLPRLFQEVPPPGPDGELHRCSRCGYPQERRPDGTWRCRSPFCERLARRLGRPAETTPGAEVVGWRMVTLGIHTYVTLPGIWELDLLEELKALDRSLEVELYPAVDQVDLVVRFPTGLVWAIDVKDWALVTEAKVQGVRAYPGAARTIIAIPEEREPRMDRLREGLQDVLGKIELATIREVVNQVRRQLGGEVHA